MTALSGYNVNNWTYNGLSFNKALGDMNDKEFNDALAKAKNQQSRLQQINNLSNNNGAGLSTNNTYANNGNSQGTKTSSDFGGDWTQGNSNFGFNNMMQQAKDMASFQLDNANKQMSMSYGFRDKEANRDSGLRMKESDQSYQQQRGLGEQNYGFQRGLADQRHGFDKAMFTLQDNAKQAETNSARQAARQLYFGGRPRPR